ncbi:MAG: hypothetical protein IPN95_12630 [Bacteroidetes bacterium]|nr:hypothetical protein [Bacteroidota bacterium]
MPFLFQWDSGDLDDAGELVELRQDFRQLLNLLIPQMHHGQHKEMGRDTPSIIATKPFFKTMDLRGNLLELQRESLSEDSKFLQILVHAAPKRIIHLQRY